MARTLSREGIEVHRFSVPASVGLPVLALFLQTLLPLPLPFFSLFDLPLLVTIFFAVARRNPVTGMMTGALIGLAQDALTHQPIGVFGIAKTVIGYLSSSIGVKVDVENPLSRLLMVFGFSLLHRGVYQLVGNQMAQLHVEWRWGHELLAAVANASLAVVLFYFLDRFKQRN